MLTALVLICSLGETPNLADCDKTNAVHVMPVPDGFASPVACFLHGQAYLAGTSISRTLAPDDRLKVVCVPERPVVVSTPPVQNHNAEGSDGEIPRAGIEDEPGPLVTDQR